MICGGEAFQNIFNKEIRFQIQNLKEINNKYRILYSLLFYENPMYELISFRMIFDEISSSNMRFESQLFNLMKFRKDGK